MNRPGHSQLHKIPSFPTELAVSSIEKRGEIEVEFPYCVGMVWGLRKKKWRD
jgi:hypothetical protein